MRQDYFSFIFESITRLLNQNASMFEAEGLKLFFIFAAIVLSWFGVQSALSAATGEGGFNWSRFVALLHKLILTYAILAGYSTPIPGIGTSFIHLVLDQVQYLVSALNAARIQDLFNSLNSVESNLPFPGPLELLQMIRFVVVLLSILGAQAVTLYVIMYGYVATAVIVLVGPIFIPFLVFPGMDWMFWGWLRAFIQYAFYQVIASGYVFVFAGFLMDALGSKDSPLSSGDLAVLFAPLVVTLFAFILATIKIPALVFSIFSGRAGDYVLGRWR